MAKIEENKRTAKNWIKIILPRVLRAAIWGFIIGGALLIFSNLTDQFELPPLEQISFKNFFLILIGFEVTIQLLRGTIFQYAISIMRTVTYMIILVISTDGGIMPLMIESFSEISQPSGVNMIFTVDFKVILGIFLLISSLSIIKTLLQAVEFMGKKVEEPITT